MANPCRQPAGGYPTPRRRNLHPQRKIPGHDLENWAQAEQEILREIEPPVRRAAIVVRVKGTQYVGEYNPSSSDDYQPGEFTSGSPVPVVFQGEKMFVKRPNGKILETKLVPGGH